MIAAVYARKSTAQEGVNEEEKSVARQVLHAKEFALKKGWHVDDHCVFVDDNVSGAEFVKRPGFLKLMNALKPKPPFQVLVMSEESRLGREQIKTSYALQQLVDAGVQVWYYLSDQERKLTTAMDKMLGSLAGFAAEMEREKASQRTHDALREKAEKFYVTGNKVFGYTNVPIYGTETNADGTRRRQHVVRQINKEQAKVVVQIFELFASGFGLGRIAKALNGDQIPPPRGGACGWCPTALRDILGRELYQGKIIWNRTQAVYRAGTRTQRIRPEVEWLRLDAPELRIISPLLWEQVEARRARNLSTYLRGEGGRLVSTPTGEDQRSPYLLSSIAKCVVCGASIVALKRGPRVVYRCSYSHKRGASVCTNNVEIRQDILDSAILHGLNEAIDARHVEAAVATALAQIKTERAHFPERRLALERELSLIETRIHHLVEIIATGFSTAAVLTELTQVEARKVVVVQELERGEDFDRVIQLDAKTLAHDLRRRLGDLPALSGRHVALARQLLRKLLDGHILCEPIWEEGKPGYRFTATGTFDRVLTGMTVLTNARGGGQGS